MVLKFYTNRLSPPATRVAVILHELGIPFDTITVDLSAKDQRKPEFLDKNPFGKVPCIDDNGFAVYESRAIARYLCVKYPEGAKFLPSGPEATALFEQMASVETAQFDPPASKIIGQKFYAPLFGGTPDEAVIAENVEKLNSVLAVYDTILSKQKYLAGDQLTLVDFFHLPVGELVERVGLLSLDDKPNVARWWNEINSRPSWQASKVQN